MGIKKKHGPGCSCCGTISGSCQISLGVLDGTACAGSWSRSAGTFGEEHITSSSNARWMDTTTIPADGDSVHLISYWRITNTDANRQGSVLLRLSSAQGCSDRMFVEFSGTFYELGAGDSIWQIRLGSIISGVETTYVVAPHSTASCYVEGDDFGATMPTALTMQLFYCNGTLHGRVGGMGISLDIGDTLSYNAAPSTTRQAMVETGTLSASVTEVAAVVETWLAEPVASLDCACHFVSPCRDTCPATLVVEISGGSGTITSEASVINVECTTACSTLNGTYILNIGRCEHTFHGLVAVDPYMPDTIYNACKGDGASRYEHCGANIGTWNCTFALSSDTCTSTSYITLTADVFGYASCDCANDSTGVEVTVWLTYKPCDYDELSYKWEYGGVGAMIGTASDAAIIRSWSSYITATRTIPGGSPLTACSNFVIKVKAV